MIHVYIHARGTTEQQSLLIAPLHWYLPLFSFYGRYLGSLRLFFTLIRAFFSSLPRVFKTKQQSVSPCPIWSKPTPVKNTKPPGSQSSWPPSSQNNRFGYFLCTLSIKHALSTAFVNMDMSARTKQLQHVSSGCLCFTAVNASFIWGFTVNHLCNLLSAHFWFAYCNPREAILRWAACRMSRFAYVSTSLNFANLR